MNDFNRDFPALKSQMNQKPLAYLDNAATTLKPQVVAEAMDKYLLHTTSNVHRGIYRLSEENTQEVEETRSIVQKFINAYYPEEVIFTSGTTDSLNILASSIGESLTENDSIILTPLEHHANIVSWQLSQARRGFKIKVLPLTIEGQLDISQLPNLIDKNTKLISFTLASNTLGTITPFVELIKIAKAHGLLVVADAAQAVAHFPIDVQALGLDFIAFSVHKLFGPTGVGVLWGKKDLLEKLPPFKGGGNMIEKVSFEKTTFNKLPEKFEAGTPAIAEIMGFKAALLYFKKLGFKKIYELEEKLHHKMMESLQMIGHVKVYGPAHPKVPIYAFNIEGIHPHDLGQILDKEGVAVRTGHHCTQPLMSFFQTSAMVRASLSFYNSFDDIEQFSRALMKAKKLLL
jgi:cysteine desulfurase / selenocysteine lyase